MEQGMLVGKKGECLLLVSTRIGSDEERKQLLTVLRENIHTQIGPGAKNPKV